MLNNWSFLRVVRLLAGIAIIIQAIVNKDTVFGVAGFLFTIMALFNTGCCGTGGCYTPVKKTTKTIIADVRDGIKLKRAVISAKPEIVIHMAAQPLVFESYKDPVCTYSTNVMGTVNMFEAVRGCSSIRAVVNVTTDKCYENRETARPYREEEPLGGYDPYSSSKACSELVTAAYRKSFFNPSDFKKHGTAVASARAGNVIGGGDWSDNRLVPDIIRAFSRGERVIIRRPGAVRPWQHVLEPLSGYLLLAEKLCKYGVRYSRAWNFGPKTADTRDVAWLVGRMCARWGRGARYSMDTGRHPHEAQCLRLDSSQAVKKLGWKSRWSVCETIDKVIEWTLRYKAGGNPIEVCLGQIEEYYG